MKFLLAFTLTALALATPSVKAAQAEDVLAEMNLARTSPKSYARILEQRMAGKRQSDGGRALREAIRFLNKARPLPPLSLSQGMSLGAQIHVNEQGMRGARGHRGPGGSSPWSRISRFGQWSGAAGENIHYGVRDARGIVCALIVDQGVPSRGHRKNIFSTRFRVTGIASGPHTSYGSMCVMDFAGGYVERGSIAAR